MQKFQKPSKVSFLWRNGGQWTLFHEFFLMYAPHYVNRYTPNEKSCSISIFCWHSGLPTVADRSASSRAFWVVWRNLSQKLSFNPLNLYNDIISLPSYVLYLKSDAEKIIPKKNFSYVFNRIFWQILSSYSKFIILGLFKWVILKFFAFANVELPIISFSDHNITNKLRL